MRKRGFPYKPLAPPDVSGDFDAVTVEDPNETYLRTLSLSERAEYTEALAGLPTKNTGGVGGCMGDAQQSSDDPYQLLQRSLAVFERQLANDQRIKKLDRVWSACMSGRGYEVQRQIDVANELLRPASEKTFRSKVTEDNRLVVDRPKELVDQFEAFKAKLRLDVEECSTYEASLERGKIRKELLEKWARENGELLVDVEQKDR
jgi:hypothetical protein